MKNPYIDENYYNSEFYLDIKRCGFIGITKTHKYYCFVRKNTISSYISKHGDAVKLVDMTYKSMDYFDQFYFDDLDSILEHTIVWAAQHLPEALPDLFRFKQSTL